MFVSMTSNINIGIRHILPVYPAIAILVAVAITSFVKKSVSAHLNNRVYGVIAVACMSPAIIAYPYFIPYFNILGGGPEKGYTIVADSNVDWGQDLKRLGDWLREHNVAKINLAYFSGWAEPTHYLGDRFIWLMADRYAGREQFINENESDGWLAISVQFLQTEKGYEWLKNEKPVAKIGYSIFIYHISPPESLRPSSSL